MLLWMMLVHIYIYKYIAKALLQSIPFTRSHDQTTIMYLLFQYSIHSRADNRCRAENLILMALEWLSLFAKRCFIFAIQKKREKKNTAIEWMNLMAKFWIFYSCCLYINWVLKGKVTISFYICYTLAEGPEPFFDLPIS